MVGARAAHTLQLLLPLLAHLIAGFHHNTYMFTHSLSLAMCCDAGAHTAAPADATAASARCDVANCQPTSQRKPRSATFSMHRLHEHRKALRRRRRRARLRLSLWCDQTARRGSQRSASTAPAPTAAAAASRVITFMAISNVDYKSKHSDIQLFAFVCMEMAQLAWSQAPWKR